MFDEREFKVEFELANPEIVIVAEVKDEIDNDYDLPYKPPSLAEEWSFFLYGFVPLLNEFFVI